MSRDRTTPVPESGRMALLDHRVNELEEWRRLDDDRHTRLRADMEDEMRDVRKQLAATDSSVAGLRGWVLGAAALATALIPLLTELVHRAWGK